MRSKGLVALTSCVSLPLEVVMPKPSPHLIAVLQALFVTLLWSTSWVLIKIGLEYFGKVFGKATVAVAPQWTSQDCSNCRARVQKSLSTRTHSCPKCGHTQDRDENAARNILQKGLATAGHVGSLASDTRFAGHFSENAWGLDVRPTPQLATEVEPRIPLL